MLILASKQIDEFTFNRLREIAAGVNIKLERGNTRNDVFTAPRIESDRQERLKSLVAIDSLLTCKKSIERLQTINKTA